MCLCPSQQSRSALAEGAAIGEQCKYSFIKHLCKPHHTLNSGGPMVRPREGGSQAISELCYLQQMHSTLLTFLPSKSAGVNNSGRVSIILILSSKWLALKILKRKQKCWFR